jgi:pimeloyl-ACP methyl ester carboxylesterase
MATLARWLGPWSDATAAPPRVAIRDDECDGIRVRIFAPRGAPRRTFLVAPGLHYAAADDPRMDRFCRVLAAAGHLVVAPFIPDYLALTPSEQAKRDFARVFYALPRWSDQRPVVFSISFGSLLALALAAEHGDAIERLVIFGGYADLRETLAFCLTGAVPSGRRATRDPLNQPVVLLNLLHLIPCDDRDAVVAGWRRYVERTWGRPELKTRDRFTAIAHELAPSVPASVRDLFLIGIGAVDGAAPLALEALERFDDRALDPRPYLQRITCRVDLVHGADDDVIPFEQSHALARGLIHARVATHVTGMYSHTGTARPPLPVLARELATLVQVLRILAG